MKSYILLILKKLIFWRPERSPSQQSNDSSQINLSLTPEAQKNIRDLMDKVEARNHAELFNRALTMYKIIIDHVDDGGKVILRSTWGTDTVFDPISFREELE